MHPVMMRAAERGEVVGVVGAALRASEDVVRVERSPTWHTVDESSTDTAAISLRYLLACLCWHGIGASFATRATQRGGMPRHRALAL